MKKQDVDYSLYLVTDSTPPILRDRNICGVVEAALKGGVTCVQFRDKTSDTGELIRIARKLHAITTRYNVPLLINDRVDVALAVGCEGCHVGQDDMELGDARRLLGPDAIIGISANTLEEAVQACKGGADYLGIGAVYATATKTNTKNILGPEGVRQILSGLAEQGLSIPTVAIGGLNTTNAEDILVQSRGSGFGLNGIAVVSVIMGSEDPEYAARDLSAMVKPVLGLKEEHASGLKDDLVSDFASHIKVLHEAHPLCHNMTNLVVQNFAANVALAVGASPIMSNNGDEAEDLAKLRGGLVINMGTVTPESLRNHQKAIRAYNAAERVVVFDPVGAGASAVRRSALKTIIETGPLTIIKGNEGEITTVFNETTTSPAGNKQESIQQRGVDSASVLSEDQRARIVTLLALERKAVVVMTGETDFVSNGHVTYAIENGHEYLGMVTGTGCVLGTTLSAIAAAQGNLDDYLLPVVAGMLLFEIAAEVAAGRPDVQGPGTFVPAFIDELARLRKLAAKGETDWLKRGNVRELTVKLVDTKP
ncbi:Hydroxyethylthiazole kinase family-domain-containing protein [Coniochaeta sp. 2T2.1]|nr:Hydroxyethylthiazole kinase family-domain-containing protein [Coniochaeta sp. 2T2.1]